ncbi:SH3 domain-containing protein [Treponema rectale]|uniref:SH3 domain-containing protein n=1 Tax=Treponema rectale TaxID=744512 RepID=A0A840S9I9_9SPIR|nr:SH3 domain-containing protein [Treponema rectale]MBB5219359.1 hypothetical protein [Treponema rectale]QOS40757.1 SH3 domain-containing protein [Treponema rectale]
MKKKLLLLFLSFVLSSIYASEKYENNKYFCTTDRLKLRENPGLDSNVLTILEEKTAVEFLQEGDLQVISDVLPDMESVEYRDNWVKIKIIPSVNEKSMVGWVYGAYLTPLNTCEIFSDEKVKCLYCDFFKVTDRTAGETNVTYYFLENEKIIYKTLSLFTSMYDGPNWAWNLHIFPRVEKNRKYLYVSSELNSSDTVHLKSVVRYDITDYKEFSREVNNDKYIKSKTKEYINDYVSYNSEKRFHLKQEMPLYKNHSFDSEIILSVTPEEKTIFPDMENLYFEDTKSGFWIAAENQSGQSGWLWFDCSN